jgi:DNA-binding transcriptional MerR regulator
MERLKSSQFLNSFDTQMNHLMNLGSERMEQQSVDLILLLADALQKLGEECDRLQDQINSDLAPTAQGVAQEGELQAIKDELARIGQQCQGNFRPSPSLRELKGFLGSWRQRFLEVFGTIAIASVRDEVMQQRNLLSAQLKLTQERVLNSSLDNGIKLEHLKELLSLEDRLQPMSSLPGEMNQLTQLKRELERVAEELKGIQSRLGVKRRGGTGGM